MTAPTIYHLRNNDGVETFTGTISPAPGGGSQPVQTFPFAFDDVGLSDGIVVWTPTVDTWLRNAWLKPSEAWDGTTPLFDFGNVADGHGLFYAASGGSAAVDAASVWTAIGDAPSFLLAGASGGQVLSFVADPYNSGAFPLPVFVPAHTPVAVWVSQDGTPGGDDPAAAHGQAVLVIDAVAA